MKDSYTFDMDAAGLDAAYEKHYQAYCRIFDRCGLKYVAVEAHSGAMGGSQSHEFMVATDAGEDYVAVCPACGYAANLEKAESVPAAPPCRRSRGRSRARESSTRPAARPSPKWPSSPALPETSQMKSLVMVADGKLVLVLVRGDHSLSETKFAGVVGATKSARRSPMRFASGSAPTPVRSARSA